MKKHLVVGRDYRGDWYEKARSFLKDNKCSDLEMEIKDSSPVSVFGSAVESLSMKTGDTIELDTEASLVVVTADLSRSAAGRECKCECGATLSCGGGGGGGS